MLYIYIMSSDSISPISTVSWRYKSQNHPVRQAACEGAILLAEELKPSQQVTAGATRGVSLDGELRWWNDV